MSVFALDTKYHTDRSMFFDSPVDVQRYDKVKYPQFEKLTEKQNSMFWRPSEVQLYTDQRDFRSLSDAEKHIFVSNLKRQILLDSVQGRAPSLAFGPICSLPELETWIQTWTYFETIHSRSYTHIIRNLYSDPSPVFDEMLEIQEIVDCAKDISKYYDNLIEFNRLSDTNGTPKNGYAHKKALWLCLNAVNALEGIRFYASFACSWNFAEQHKMEGNAKIIKFIARDENIHLAATQQILKLLPKDDTDFIKIKEECSGQVEKLWIEVVEQEKLWCKFLFKYGSMIGLSEDILCSYLEHIAHKRMTAIGVATPYKSTSNPLPWTNKWISGHDVQVAPQETEISQYLLGAIHNNLTEDTFRGFKL